MKQYVVDAFTDSVFGGNPAAVCLLQEWVSDDLLLNIAKENSLSETAFVVSENDGYRLRWFTPGGEIDLCGHATLATAYVLTRFVCPEREVLDFVTKSGLLSVRKKGDLFEMDFPSYDLRAVEVTDTLCDGLGARPREVYMGRDLLCVFDDEQVVRNLCPDMKKLLGLDGLLVHATAAGREYDCVSRSFAPKLGIDEDPVCGSGHCHIVPFWTKVFNKKNLVAYQASQRGGILYCEERGKRIRLSGKAVLYAIAEILVE